MRIVCLCVFKHNKFRINFYLCILVTPIAIASRSNRTPFPENKQMNLQQHFERILWWKLCAMAARLNLLIEKFLEKLKPVKIYVEGEANPNAIDQS